MPYVYLLFAVLAETIGTTALQASQQFTKAGPSVVVVLAYGAAFYLLSMVLKVMPVGITYALWSGFGIIFIAMIGLFVFNQRLDWPAILGIGLILAGIVVINLFSQTTRH